MALEVFVPQALVLAPTREIATQIADVITLVGKHLPALRVNTFIGGMKVKEDRLTLSKVPPHVVIGTPGRVLDLLNSKSLSPSHIRMFVLDEADLLLHESFQGDILEIFKLLQERKQVLAFSATFPPNILNIATSLMRHPETVRLCSNDEGSGVVGLGGSQTISEGKKGGGLETVSGNGLGNTTTEKDTDDILKDSVLWLHGVTQYYKVIETLPVVNTMFTGSVSSSILSTESEVNQVLSNTSFHQAIIFCNHRGQGERLAATLNASGWPTAYIAGEMTQRERNSIMSRLRTFTLRILVTTDLTSRGIDVGYVNLVINVGLPKDVETYLHRIGRTGRYGSYGVAVNIVSQEQNTVLQGWVDLLSIKMQDLPLVIPSDGYMFDITDDEIKTKLHLLNEIRNEAITYDEVNAGTKLNNLTLDGGKDKAYTKDIAIDDESAGEPVSRSNLEAGGVKCEVSLYDKWISKHCANFQSYSQSYPWTDAWHDY